MNASDLRDLVEIRLAAFEVFDGMLTQMAAAGLHPLKASSDPEAAHFTARDVLSHISSGKLQLPEITPEIARRLAQLHPFSAEDIFEGFRGSGGSLKTEKNEPPDVHMNTTPSSQEPSNEGCQGG